MQQKNAEPRYEGGPSEINFIEVLRLMSIAYTAVLEISEDCALFLSALLHAERQRRGTRKGRRASGTYKQAVLVLRWFLDDTRMSALARDNGIALSTAYDYRDEGITVLDARKPSLHGALLAARWIIGRKGVYEFSEVFDEIIASSLQ